MRISSQTPQPILRDSTAVILAGGYGTRLASVVPDLPKPMAPVGGRPFLAYLLEYLRDAGVADVVLCVCHMADVIQGYFEDGRRFGLRIRYSLETTACGTAGALRQAAIQIQTDHVLILNGDSFFPVDLGMLLAAQATSDAELTMAVTRVPDCSRYGHLTFDASTLRITGFHEKDPLAKQGGWINTGIYAVQKRFCCGLPDTFPCSLEKEVFPVLCRRHAMTAFPSEGPFLDIGTPESYQAAALFFRAGRRATAEPVLTPRSKT